MTPERILGALIQGVLGGRRRKKRGALRYLTGGKGSLLNASTLLTAAGLVWGAYEAATRKHEPPPSPSAAPPVPTPPAATPRGSAGTVPPLPAPGLSPELLRLVRLTISAARADGTLSAEERDRILSHAREVGAEAVVERELQSPRPLAEIVSGVTDPRLKSEMYLLAFALVRADEEVTGAERIYLAQLAHQLGLDKATTARLESEAASKIAAGATE